MISYFRRDVNMKIKKIQKNPLKVLTIRKNGDIIDKHYGNVKVTKMPEWRNWQTPGT